MEQVRRATSVTGGRVEKASVRSAGAGIGSENVQNVTLRLRE